MTSAQVRDLTYGREELRPPGVLRRPAAARQGRPRADLADLPEAPATNAGGCSEAGGQSEAGGHSELVLKPGPESVKAARDFTAEILHSWGFDGLIQEAMIIASELVTNAIKHGTSLTPPSADLARVELAWQRYASRVICVVTDGSSRQPVLGPADMCSESGRGLQVVHALAAAWGWMVLGAREKAVWAAMLLP